MPAAASRAADRNFAPHRYCPRHQCRQHHRRPAGVIGAAPATVHQCRQHRRAVFTVLRAPPRRAVSTPAASRAAPTALAGTATVTNFGSIAGGRGSRRRFFGLQRRHHHRRHCGDRLRRQRQYADAGAGLGHIGQRARHRQRYVPARRHRRGDVRCQLARPSRAVSGLRHLQQDRQLDLDADRHQHLRRSGQRQRRHAGGERQHPSASGITVNAGGTLGGNGTVRQHHPRQRRHAGAGRFDRHCSRCRATSCVRRRQLHGERCRPANADRTRHGRRAPATRLAAPTVKAVVAGGDLFAQRPTPS